MDDRKRQAIETKADKLVEKTFGHPLFCLRLEPGTGSYEAERKVFNLLFHHKDPDYKVALWNNLCIYGHFEELKKEAFSEEELAFIQKQYEAWSSSVNQEHINMNAPFTTSRLRLRPTQGDADLKLYWKHLREDGDFSLFTNLKYAKNNIERFGFDMPFFFVVEEKASREMVGYVGIRWEKNQGFETGVMECEYYIFKPQRHKGYASEALTALCRKAFSEKLYEQVDTKYQYVYRKRRAKPQIIRAIIREDNAPSRALVEHCGFQHTGTLHRHFWAEDRYVVNGEIYELCKD